ncbi:MAG: hemin-degrading factor [Saprospiraceae bacterium]|nr:hemin-degrading factor [Saprospiraceae bacterium]
MITSLNPIELKTRYQDYKTEHPKKRIRDAAKDLGVTELELLSLFVGEHVTRLRSVSKDILKEIEGLGQVMALTRNEHVVHERKGIYHNVSFMDGHANMGLVVNPDIDLRLFMNAWSEVFAVKLEVRGRTLYGLQFFSNRGEAVHKIYLTPKSNEAAYHELVAKYKADNQDIGATVDRSPQPVKEYAKDEEVNVEDFHKEWIEMKDTHHFFGMLRSHKLARLQALRLAPKGYAFQVDNNSIKEVINQAAKKQVPIMVFANSSGCIQIHTGEVKKIVEMGDWYNVMDPLFNLHLNMKGVAQTWVVLKNTTEGIVTSIELFDEEGNLIVYCFGKRKPGIPELESWRSIIDSIISND